MADVGESEHEYLGYSIEVAGFTELRKLAARVDIWLPATNKENDDPQIFFIEELSATLKRRSRDWPDDDVEAVERVMERGLHRARGAILLDQLDQVNERRLSVPTEPQFAQRSDDYVRRLILGAFRRELERNPSTGDHLEFDDIGVALVENIDPNKVWHVLRRLEIAGHVKPWTSPNEPGHRPYIITQKGLEEADRLAIPARAPGLLLEETVATVESVLNRHKSDLAEALRRQSIRVAEAQELGDHEVGEIAQACEQIIWDFLDLDVLWEGVPGKRPPRGSTRDRLRLLLKARVPSQTEAELLEGLEQYIVGWFGPLEQFIHKYRKLPGESERAHAKRIVVYTYMLLGDLIEVLAL